jgi:hypothetical protein
MQKKYMGNFGGASIIKDQSLLNHEAIKQQIIILDELRDLIPPLQEDESTQLEKNILAEGCREALLIWQTTPNVLDTNSMQTSAVYVLIDGHNRYGICLKHKLNFKIHLISFNSLKEVRDYMIDNQLGRRNLIPEQASYLRGLRYNTEKLEKGKYSRHEHKGQNVPYDMVVSSIDNSEEKVEKNHKGQNVPYRSIDKKESTSARLSKQYNVSEKTIKRDAEFAEGLNMLSAELKRDILAGRVKAKKSDIQHLTQLEKPSSPIDSLDKVTDLISANVTNQINEIPAENSVMFTYKNSDSREKLVKKVSKSIKRATASDVIVEIKGSFIINNGLVDTWKKLRGFSEDVIIDENFTDRISFLQTVSLGIIQ